LLVPAGRGRRLDPDVVLGEEPALLSQPGDQFVLQRSALGTIAPRPIVEDELSGWLEDPLNLGRDLQEEALEPIPFVPLSIAVLGLPLVGRRSHAEVQTFIRHLRQNGHAIEGVDAPESGLRVDFEPRRI
jgi:hypothetical protein